MKRTGFAQPPRKPAKVIEYTPRPRTPAKAVLVADGKARMCVQIPKAQPLRSEPYRRLVASLPCAWCGVEGYSQAAHKNQNKAMGAKTSDAEIFPLCGLRLQSAEEFRTATGLCTTLTMSGCHALLDSGGRLNKTERRELEELWACQTRQKLREMAAGDAKVRAVVERTIGM